VKEAQEKTKRLEYVKIILDVEMNHEVFSDGVDTCTSFVLKYGDWLIVAGQKHKAAHWQIRSIMLFHVINDHHRVILARFETVLQIAFYYT
jgi:hypothetical protein